MKWLQWSKADLAHGVGGLETHARSLSRELKKKGIDPFFSQDPRDLLEGPWDVIHTHGGEPPLILNFKAHLKRTKAKWIHTLHGSTLERMWACGEYFWPGGYGAFSREWAGVIGADIIFSIRPDIFGLSLVSKLSRVVICSNGWDSWGETSKLETELRKKLGDEGSFWLYVGRGSDKVKGVHLLEKVLEKNPEIRLVIAPGEGFKDHPRILKTGPLEAGHIKELLKMSQGLFLTSLYEGLPLVVLEALGEGVPVVTTKVGGLKTLSPSLKGLYYADSVSSDGLERAWLKAREDQKTAEPSREKIQDHNRKILLTWKQVTEIYLREIEGLK